MKLFVEMEDGVRELVAHCHMSSEKWGVHFKVHHWGDVWLVATLNDDTRLIDENGKWMSMGALRQLEAGVTVALKSGGELRRPHTFANRKGVNKQARPFTTDK